MQFWNVYLNGKWLDSVPYDKNCDKEYIRKGLIEHDGYDPSIWVRQASKTK